MKHIEFEDTTLNMPTKTKKNPPKKDLSVKVTNSLKPGLDWDGENVEVTSDVYVEPIKDWDTLLNELGYDPELYEVLEPVKISSWDAQTEEGGKRLYSYKVNIKTKQTTTYRDEDYKELVRQIKKHRPHKQEPAKDGFFVVNLSDWQMGKADGDGTDGTVKRLLQMIDDVDNRIDELKKIGRNIDTLVVACLGDMIENCEGNYQSQTFTVELNRRQQIRVTRRILIQAITRWSKKFKKVVCLAVPGNHGENRINGKAYTTRGDNDDVAVLEMVYDVLQSNPEAYGHVEFVIPEDEIYVILDLGGTLVGWTHGHITNGGADPQKKIKEWWKNQSFAGEPIGYVNILNTGHYHHLLVSEHDGDRIHFQAPSIDGGSTWYKELTGIDSRPGTLTYIVDSSDKPYRDLEVL
jgi:hypothetical protein